MTTVVSLVGWDRSGSTLLAGVLGSLPDAVSVGEVVNLWHRGLRDDRVCSCGSVFSECVFWTAVIADAFGQPPGELAGVADAAKSHLGNLWLLASSLPVVGASLLAHGDRYVALLDALYAAIAKHAAAETIIDASKTPWHALAAQGTSHETKVVHVVRDPRGVAHSLRKQLSYDDGEEMNRHSATFSTAAWVYRNALADWHWSGTDRYVCVRHEDLVADPAGELDRIVATLGIGHIVDLVDAAGRLRVAHPHNVSGNPNRFVSGPVVVRRDGEWRSALPTSTQRYVLALSWPMRKRYGY